MVISASSIRELTSHRVNGLNEAIRVFVLDAPGAGFACHDYIVLVPMSEKDQDINHPEQINWDRCSERHSWTDKNSLAPYTLIISTTSAAIIKDETIAFFTFQRIQFQNGPVKEAGYNGNSHEALIAVLLDRLEHFQEGPYRCRDNQMAIDHLDEVRLWLHKRTMDRVTRNVEGTHQK